MKTKIQIVIDIETLGFDPETTKDFSAKLYHALVQERQKQKIDSSWIERVSEIKPESSGEEAGLGDALRTGVKAGTASFAAINIIVSNGNFQPEFQKLFNASFHTFKATELCLEFYDKVIKISKKK